MGQPNIQFAQGGGDLQINQVHAGLGLTYGIAVGGTNIAQITINVTDAKGNNVAQVFEISVWLSDASTGAGLTATTASGGLSVTTGTQIAAKVAAKALDCLTDATGKLVFTITDTANTGFFIAAECPGSGITIVSRQLVAGDY